jgi:hypothetical protein
LHSLKLAGGGSRCLHDIREYRDYLPSDTNCQSAFIL